MNGHAIKFVYSFDGFLRNLYPKYTNNHELQLVPKIQVPDDQLNDEKDIDDKDNECTKSNLKPEKTTRGEVIGNTSDSGPAEKQEEDSKSDGSDQNEEIEKQHGITYLLIVRVFIRNTNKHCNTCIHILT